MPDPILIRARAGEGRATVRVLMAHEMESGQRRDAEGRTVPAWFIQEVVVQLNGTTVLTAQWGPSVARNPFLQFSIRGAQPGDTVRIAWTDNRGETRADEAQVA
ncbi:thiosulfate oxidation carrier complex protein SoxZ [Aquincola sp. MAHUQ-54]|uniref:Thiosulfate oxidation carrier complex protein SoxZ n=1 Tax=Aquincola agrisoli TaxID=3119538 RepID=A0AAW9QGG8_9BURK